LTKREEDVLRLMADSLNNKDIAAKLSLSEGTVKNHISAILSKRRSPRCDVGWLI
jgi:DNA-binding NarL/FixJ family response regulator